MLGTLLEQTALMNANMSITIAQYVTESLNQRKIAVGKTLTTRLAFLTNLKRQVQLVNETLSLSERKNYFLKETTTNPFFILL